MSRPFSNNWPSCRPDPGFPLAEVKPGSITIIRLTPWSLPDNRPLAFEAGAPINPSLGECMPRTELLISDCDGVIVDSEIISHRVLFESLSAHVPAQALEAALEGTFGLTTPSIIDLIEKRFDLQLGADFESDLRRLTEQRVAAEAQPIAHVREALIAIDLPLAVASNSRRHNVEASLRRAGLAERIAGNFAGHPEVLIPRLHRPSRRRMSICWPPSAWALRLAIASSSRTARPACSPRERRACV